MRPFGRDRISDTVSDLLSRIRLNFICSPDILGLFKTVCFSFAIGFLPVSPGCQFRNQCINDRFYLLCLKFNPDFSVRFPLETFCKNSKFLCIYFCILIYQSGIIKMYTSCLSLRIFIKYCPKSIFLDKEYMGFGL